MSASFRQLPKVDVLLREPRLACWPHDVAVDAARWAIERARDALRADRAMPDVARIAGDRAGLLARGRMRPVINATGVVIHTNLGRAPWAEEAVNAAMDVARGYCNLELELATGRRGGRVARVEKGGLHGWGASPVGVVAPRGPALPHRAAQRCPVGKGEG